jgi:hypothetical protein
VQGFQGIQGITGITGSQGVQGITGASGSQGTQGSGVSSGSLLVTASFANTNITFTKGDATTFDLPGFATTGSNTFRGNQTMTGSLLFGSSSNYIHFQGDDTNGLEYSEYWYNGMFVKGVIPSSPFNGTATTLDPGGLITITDGDATYTSSGYFGITNGATGRPNVLGTASASQSVAPNIFGQLYGVDDAISYITFPSYAIKNSGSVISKLPLIVENTFTASLQQGYAWVGNGSNISTLVATSSFGGGGSINTGSFITTGSATNASQTIKGGFTFDTNYTTSGSWSSAGGGAKIIYVNYGDVFNGSSNGEDFIWWLDTNFSGVTVSGTGITNGAIFNYSYGASDVEVEITTGTIVSGSSYTFTGPGLQTIQITGSLNASRAIKTFGPNGSTLQNQTGIVVSTYDASQQTFINGTNWYLSNTNNNDTLNIANYENTPNLGESAWVFLAADSGGSSYGPAIAIQGNLGLTGSAINNAPIFLYRKTIISSSLDVRNTFTASLANGFTYVGDSNNRTKLVATSSFGTSINTGSFATTGSNQFNGNQTITGSLYAGVIGQQNILKGQTVITGSLIISGSGNSFTGSQFISGGVVITGQIQTGPNQYSLETDYTIRAKQKISANGLILSGSNNEQSLNIYYPNTRWQHAGNVLFTNQIDYPGSGSYAGSGSIEIYALGGANLALTGSQLTLSGVDFIPFSASLNSRINAITGSGGSGSINTGSLMVTGSFTAARFNFTKGDGTTFTTPNNSQPGLVTLGTATTALQTIKGDFAFDTSFTATPSASAQQTGVNTLYLDYGFIYGNDYDTFNWWTLNNFSGVTISGTGIVNGTVTGYGYGNYFEVYFTSGATTNGLTYTLTGPSIQNITVVGGMTSNYQLGLQGNNGESCLLTPNGGLYTQNAGGAYYSGLQGGNMGVNESATGNALIFTITSSFIGQTLWEGPQIAISDGVNGAVSNIGFQGANNYTDGRVTILTPLVAQSGSIVTGSLDVSNTFTASLANGYTWVGDSNNKTKLVATSSFTSQGVQGLAGQSGSQGLQGTGGSQGATTQGAQGVSGSQGPQGISVQGAPGQSITGQSGSQGPQGTSGTGGQQGVSGSQGTQGVQGATGTNGYGYQGLNTTASLTLQTGTITFTTNTNVTSNAFQTGNRIRLAYQSNPSLYWEEGVITAYTTNQMTVLIDLVNVSGGTYSGFDIGITGQQGNIGLQGIQGTNGQQGTQGIQGAQGAGGAGGQQGTQGATGTGTQGANGAQGATGTGTQGANGAQGGQGYTGAGSQGAAGGQGLQGFIGGAGQQGTQGATGGTGGVGNQGAAGSNGSNGAQGATGAQGTTGTTGTGFSTISPANNNALVISNGTSNSAFTNSNIYVSGDTIYAGAYYQNSSRELKTNITPFDKDAIELLKKVSVVTFYYKNDTFTPHIGFIAEDTPTELSGVNQNMMDVASVTGTLIKAVQELQAQIDELKAR